MKISYLAVLLLLALFLSAEYASAQCLNISIAKSSYLSGETIEAEITASNLTRKITYGDINFYYGGKKFFPDFSLSQLSSNKWIIFMEAPAKYGLHSISIEKMICRHNGMLVEDSENSSLIIKKPIQDYYSLLLSKIGNEWTNLNVDEISQSLLALSDVGYNPSFLEIGKASLMLKGNGECWPAANCTVRSTALALMALKDKAPASAKDWLIDARNSAEGVWELNVNSAYETRCNTSVNGNLTEHSIIPGLNSFPLIMPDIPVIDVSSDCPNANISHTLSTHSYQFPLGKISNEKCWGREYRGKCDLIASAYALDFLSDSEAENWVISNAKSTEELAYAYLHTNRSELRSWLKNNQHPAGYWPSNSISASDLLDLNATLVASRALVNNTLSENWIRGSMDVFSLETLASSLRLFSHKIEPVVSFQGGIVRVASDTNASIKFSNEGIFPAKVILSLSDSSSEKELPAKTALFAEIKAPSVREITFSSIEVLAKTNGYERTFSIPVVIFPNEEQRMDANLLDITLNKPVINSSYNAQEEIEPFIQSVQNQTKSATQVLSEKFKFMNYEVNRTLKQGEKITVTLALKNSDSEEITAYLSLWGLSGLIESMPPSVNLKPNSITSFNIIMRANYPMDYAGHITAESNGDSALLPIYVQVNEVIVNKSCEELKGILCNINEQCSGKTVTSNDGICCLTKCIVPPPVLEAPKSRAKIIIISIAAFAFIALAVFFVLRLKKKKDQIRNPAIDILLAKLKAESQVSEAPPSSPEKK